MDGPRERQWHRLPSTYEDCFSSASLLAAPYPFAIGTYNAYNGPSKLHWHDSFEIGYVLNGRGVFVIEEHTFPFQPGQVHVVNNTDRHMAFSDSCAQFFNIHFHPDLLRDSTFPTLEGAAQRLFTLGSQRFAPVLPADNPHTLCVIELLHRIAEEHRTAALHWPLAVKGLLLQVTSLLLRHFPAVEVLDEPALRRQEVLARLVPALRSIEQRLADPPTITELASTVALSPSRFNALFGEAMGTSPVAYRNWRRIVRAQRLLAVDTSAIGEIAEQCGFNTVQQFNQLFARIAGCTPTSYRRRLAPQAQHLAAHEPAP